MFEEDWGQPIDQSEQQLVDAELMRSELEYLRDRVKLLEQIAIEQAQELREANREMESLNRELQQMFVNKQLAIRAAIEPTPELIAKREPIREEVAQLPGASFDETVILGELVETPELSDRSSSSAQAIPLPAPQTVSIDSQCFTPAAKPQASRSRKARQSPLPKPDQARVEFSSLAEQERIVKEVIETRRQLSASLQQLSAVSKLLITESRNLVKKNATMLNRVSDQFPELEL